VCGGDNGTVGENGAQVFVLKILGQLWKMDPSCVWC